MAITLNLAPEEETLVRQKAQAEGREAENYVAELVLRDINSLAKPTAETPTRSLAEMLHGRIGLFENDGAAYEAQEASQAFAEHLAEKHRSGTL